MNPKNASNRQLIGSSLRRGAAFLGLWLILAGFSGSAIWVGLLAAAGATVLSCRLLPPGEGGWDLAALLRLAWALFYQSMRAGVDVAWRAMAPKLPINPGIVEVTVSIPEGTGRSVFLALTSLMPGSLPAGDRGDIVEFHCLDVDQPVAKDMTAFEKQVTTTWRRS